jgi:hypothetical protein
MDTCLRRLEEEFSTACQYVLACAKAQDRFDRTLILVSEVPSDDCIVTDNGHHTW